MFSNTFAGIAPASVAGYIVAQAVGGLLAALTVRTLYPDVTAADAATVLVPHDGGEGRVAEASGSAGLAVKTGDANLGAASFDRPQ